MRRYNLKKIQVTFTLLNYKNSIKIKEVLFTLQRNTNYIKKKIYTNKIF